MCEAADNVGITAFEIRSVPVSPLEYRAFLEVTNASPGPKDVSIRLSGSGGGPPGEDITLQPGESQRPTTHLPTLDRAPARDPRTGDPAPVRKWRSHHLQTPRDPAFLRQAFHLEAATHDGITRVSIRNRTGHRVPGLAQRTLEFRFELLDADGKTCAELRHTIDMRRHLPVDELLELELDGVGTTVRDLSDHKAPGLYRAVRFLDETFPVASEKR